MAIIGKVSEIDLKIKALQEKKKHIEERNLHDLAKVLKKLDFLRKVKFGVEWRVRLFLPLDV